MKSPTQLLLNSRRFLASYEDSIYPKFLTKYARREITYPVVYDTLRSLEPVGYTTPQGSVILDLGCGTGWFARRLAQEKHYKDAKIIGLDLSANAIAIARERAANTQLAVTPDFRIADVLAPFTIPDQPVSEVWICGALHQMRNQRQVLSRVRELLADNGLVYVQTFVEDPTVNEKIDMAVMRWLGHRVFRSGELDAIIADCGFTEIGSTSFGLIYFSCLTPSHNDDDGKFKES